MADQVLSSHDQSASSGLETSAYTQYLEGYARLLVQKGVALKPGQRLCVNGPVEAHEFVRTVVKCAYELGSGEVTVIYSDDTLANLTYNNNPVERFETVPAWEVERLNMLAREGAAFLFLEGEDPSALKDVDPAKPAANAKARNQQCTEFRHALDFGVVQWCIAGVPTKAWAAAVFPDLETEKAMEALWNAVLMTARADNDDPQAAWDAHRAAFEAHKKFLNEHHFDRLRYTNSVGTQLEVGLTDKHVWSGGGAHTADDHFFFPNMPTEECFTTPDFRRTNGTVFSALPLIHNGNMVDKFWFTFKEGSVVDYGAEVGKDILDHLLATDDGAKRLGEVALVPKESPIRQSGLLFFSTLYDENASCHLAIGKGFADCYEGGLEMDKASLSEHGVNDSLTHVDFMIGTEDLSITGIQSDGAEVPIFVNGTWAPGL